MSKKSAVLGMAAAAVFSGASFSADPMTDASLELGFVNSGTSPTGSETLSNGSTLSVSSSSTSDSTTFAATTSLNVTDTLSLDVTTVRVQFSESAAAVPEPSSLALLGVGLPALGLMRRRKRP